MKNLINLKSCPICKKNSKKIYQFYSYEKTINKKVLIKINQCNASNCHHIFLSEYNKKDLALHYRYPRYKTKITKADIEYLKSRVGFIQNNKSSKKINSVLEVGPGDGHFLKFLKVKNNFFFDLNPNVIKICKKKYKFFNFKQKNKKFDLICACHVLEHAHDPYIFLKNLRNVLSKDGKIFIEIPDFSYFSEPENIEDSIYEHLHYFSIKSIQNLFDRLGLEVISIKRNLNKNNKTCINYAMQILATFKTSKKNTFDNVLKVKNINENKIIKRYLRNKKNILFWGIGTTFFQYAIKAKLQFFQKNIFCTDIREYGKNIFGYYVHAPKEFYKKNFDLLVLTTTDISNVKDSLSKLKIKYKRYLLLK